MKISWLRQGADGAPLSLKKLLYLDGQKAVLFSSRMNPSLGRNFEVMDPWNGWRAWPTTFPTPANIAPLLWLPRKPRPGLPAGDRGVGRPGRANHQAALCAELGEAHQQ